MKKKNLGYLHIGECVPEALIAEGVCDHLETVCPYQIKTHLKKFLGSNVSANFTHCDVKCCSNNNCLGTFRKFYGPYFPQNQVLQQKKSELMVLASLPKNKRNAIFSRNNYLIFYIMLYSILQKRHIALCVSENLQKRIHLLKKHVFVSIL